MINEKVANISDYLVGGIESVDDPLFDAEDYVWEAHEMGDDVELYIEELDSDLYLLANRLEDYNLQPEEQRILDLEENVSVIDDLYWEWEEDIEWFVDTRLDCETWADTDYDGEISMPELLAYVESWKQGDIDMSQLLMAIGFWKQGEGC